MQGQRPPKRTTNRKPPVGPKKGDAPKFWFHDGHCWRCDATDHTRDNCPEYKNIIRTNDGKRPKGYKGAFETAPDAFRAKHGTGITGGANRLKHTRDRKPKSHVKPMTESDAEIEDDTDMCDLESSDSDDEAQHRMGSMQCQTSVFTIRCSDGFQPVEEGINMKPGIASRLTVTEVNNSFQSLNAEDNRDPDEAASEFGTWAHTVKVGKEQPEGREEQESRRHLEERGRARRLPAAEPDLHDTSVH